MTVPVHQLADSDDYLKVLDEHPQHFTPGERFAFNIAGFVLFEPLIRELATLRFIDQGANILFIGPPGAGKTMLAVGLARAATATAPRP